MLFHVYILASSYTQLPVRTDPEDKSLVFDFKLTGRPAPNHTHVVYKRGTNSKEFLNRPLEDVMPNLATVQYATILMQWWITANISHGVKRLQQPAIGCHDFSLVNEGSMCICLSAMHVAVIFICMTLIHKMFCQQPYLTSPL